MNVKLAAGLLVLASTIAGVSQASADVRRGQGLGHQALGHNARALHRPLPGRLQTAQFANPRFVKLSEQRAEARHVMLRERQRARQRRTVDAEDRPTGLPGRPLMVHNDGDDPGIALVTDNTTGSRLVAEARRWIGTNPTTRATLWCARFMNFVLERLGLPGTESDLAKSFASYGKPLEKPKVGAIAVMNRKGGGHVGVVSGFDKDGDPIIISGNYSRRVAEAVYARSRIITYVSPDI
jgi:uncharacterized protein (TIGR02594 family)